MRRNLIFLLIIVVLGVTAAVIVRLVRRPSAFNPESFRNSITAMKIESPAFEQNGMIPTVHTCDGADTSPPLVWRGVPEGTRSLVLVVDDPDAPVGTWTHWLVWNIDPVAAGTAAGQVPVGGIQGRNDFGRNVWGGPCPQGGSHRYFFKLFALHAILDLPADTK